MNETGQRSLTIDGRPVTAGATETLLEVARRHGFEVPTLCYHKSVLPYGACRLCVMDVTRGGRTRLVVSCVYQPGDGDVVDTNSARVRQTRRMVLELILSKCPQVEAIRELARQYGVEEPRFPVPPGADPARRCILCGRCVRVCRDVIGQAAIGYAYRGAKRVISAPLGGEAARCIGCGACIHVCPTGALHAHDDGGVREMQEHHARLPLVACRVCGASFVTVKQAERLDGRTAVPVETLMTCPACRRNATAQASGESELARKQGTGGAALCQRS